MLVGHTRHLIILCFQWQEPIRTLRSCLTQKQSSQVMHNLISPGIRMWVSHRSIGCEAAVSAISPPEQPRGKASTSGRIKDTRNLTKPGQLANAAVFLSVSATTWAVSATTAPSSPRADSIHLPADAFQRLLHIAQATFGRQSKEGIKGPESHPK